METAFKWMGIVAVCFIIWQCESEIREDKIRLTQICAEAGCEYKTSPRGHCDCPDIKILHEHSEVDDHPEINPSERILSNSIGSPRSTGPYSAMQSKWLNV